MTASPHSVSLSTLIWSGVRHNRRTYFAVALGVAVATSVIVGALLVGDSMRGSLKALTIERLGTIESVTAPGGFFAADKIGERLGVAEDSVAAVVLFDRAVVEASGSDDAARRAGSVQVIGCDESFWRLDVSGVVPEVFPDDESVVLTESIARDLGVEVGDEVTVRLPVEQAVPADSPLGRRDVQTEGIPRLRVIDILPDRGLARFSLAASQAAPRNVFLSRDLVAEVLERDGQANVVLASAPIEVSQIDVSPEDVGLKLRRVTSSFDDEVVFDYFYVTSDRMLIDQTAVDAIADDFPDGTVQPVLTYLANAIRIEDSPPEDTFISYSTVSAMDTSPAFPLDYSLDGLDVEPDRIPVMLNAWAAQRLNIQRGARLKIDYFEPEVENGNEVERSFLAVVTGIVPITEPARAYRRTRKAVFDEKPTIYNDPDLTPTVPGVTDQDSMSDWDTPFELKNDVPDEDDVYYQNHRLTPKVFLPLEVGQKLFRSRFGQTTGLRIATTVAADEDEFRMKIESALHPVTEQLGWSPRTIRSDQVAASQGTTPFDGLFLSLSFFVILAAIMLIAMLFRLSLVVRAAEIGTLMAVGLQKKQVMRLFLGEGLIVAIIGTVLGLLGGIGYAYAALAALRTFWVGAVTVPFLTYHGSMGSLIGGGAIGLFIGMLTLGLTVRGMLRHQAISLLRGDTDQAEAPGTRPRRWLVWAAAICAVAAFGAAIGGAFSGGQTAAGGFVGGGMLLLIAALLMVFDVLAGRERRTAAEQTTGWKYSLGRLAKSAASRSPFRSTLTVGLMATASFLIVAITAFRLQPTDEGTGSFDLVGDSAQPIYEDLNDPIVRRGLFGADESELKDVTLTTLRLRSGQDASCNNLYRATEPTVLGVPAHVNDSLSKFRFFASAPNDGNAWALLNQQAEGTEDDPIPVILDQNTAMWSLQMLGGIGEVKEFVYETQSLYFKVVGLLENSLLQGRLMVGEENFVSVFPEVNGYRFLLVETANADQDVIAGVLETRLGDTGLDVSDSSDVLSGMMAVQNTYLRTFQSLGGLGLVLGTIGLAVAQLRNVLQRRKEFAVLRAIGFTRRRLAWLVLGETASLLVLGIGCGVVCAVLAVMPYTLLSSNRPPIVEPIVLVFGIFLFGLLAGLLASGRVARMRLLDALRGS
ncbi:MAG: FtsX-like permease family protein [Planctomycetota bacterium]